MRAVTLNVQKDMGLSRLRKAERRRRVFADVHHAATLGGLIGWQEMETPDHHEALRSLKGFAHYIPTGSAGAVPISWRTSVFELLDSGTILTTHGRARVSPSRFLNFVILRHKASGKTIARVNTHVVSGGWSKGIRPTTTWRRTEWAKHMKAMEALVLRLDAAGHFVIGGGDMNRSRVTLMPSPRIVQDVLPSFRTHGRALYDYLFHVRRHGLVFHKSLVVGGFYSDHDAVVATYTIH